MGRAATNE